MTNLHPLSVTNPDLTAEWHPTLNGELTPDKITQGSGKVVWWLGSNCQHEWDVKICIRTSQNQGCPICSNSRTLVGFNDLTTTHLSLSKEWHPTKNNSLKPEMVVRGSNVKVWWKDSLDHEWEARITDRANKNSKCPYCAGQKILIGFNDLKTTHPKLVDLIHKDKNPGLDIEAIQAGNKKRKIHWICKKNHEWSSPVAWQAIKEGIYCSLCAGRNLEPGINDFETMNPDLAKEWHPTLNGDLLPSQMRTASHKKVWWVGSTCKHEWQSVIKNRTGKEKNGCPKCAANKFISKGEQAIADYLRSLGFIVEQTNRKILNGVELDIVIHEKNLAIEFNGIYYHTEDMGKGRNYHYDKWSKAKDAGYQLIQIWEDEWLSNPERIKNILSHKLGMSASKRVFARKTSIVIMSTADAKTFFEAHHIQGFSSGSYYFGLADASGDILSAMILKKEPKDVLNIVRYATSATVVGGFTKILKYFEKNVPVSSFITFSDNCISDGGLYENNGFIADKEIRPDYRYVVGLTRAHKFGYRLKRFRNDPDLLWEDGLTERELAKLNNLPRIWDAGKTRWRKNIG